ncbi:MAG TPA: hypothetical protein VMT73_13790 [Anaerolineales bacterium]|nr:hypothetical protein [Anaerolineales bacterium]
MNRSFAFTSGGAHRLGTGEWKIRADENGSLAIQHDLYGSVRDFGTFDLSPDESASLWNLIAGAAFEKRVSTSRPGIPDESMLGFALFAQATLHSVQLWASEALEDLSIKRLVEEIGKLIEKYTGRKPVLT